MLYNNLSALNIKSMTNLNCYKIKFLLYTIFKKLYLFIHSQVIHCNITFLIILIT